MRLSDLQDKRVRDASGKGLGRVHEVHVDGGRIVALVIGPGGLIERMTARSAGRKVSWEAVSRVSHSEIVLSE